MRRRLQRFLKRAKMQITHCFVSEQNASLIIPTTILIQNSVLEQQKTVKFFVRMNTLHTCWLRFCLNCDFSYYE